MVLRASPVLTQNFFNFFPPLESLVTCRVGIIACVQCLAQECLGNVGTVVLLGRTQYIGRGVLCSLQAAAVLMVLLSCD